jgi:acyl carrier protein
VAAVQADVAAPDALGAALSEATRGGPPLRGIVHAAGRLDDALLADLGPERLRSVMQPKIEGAWNLDLLTRGQPLDFFVMFSSAAAILGSPGQANYAAANAALDAIAHDRRMRGLPALTLNWGPWSEVGLAARADRGGRLAASGVQSLSPADGAAALARVLGTGAAQICVMPVDWPAWVRNVPAIREIPLLTAFTRGGRADEGSAANAHGIVAALGAAAPADRPRVLEKHLQEQVARVLRLPAAKLDVTRPLSTMGLDSLMAVELKNRIESELQVALPLIQVVQGPSVSELAEALLAQMHGGESAAAPAASRPAAAPRGKESLMLSLLSLGKDAGAPDA